MEWDVLNRLQEILSNLRRKKADFQYELSITSSPEKKFELEKLIEKCDYEILKIQKEIDDMTYRFSHTYEVVEYIPEIEIDLTQLEEFLSQGKWQEADEETYRVISISVKTEGEVYHKPESFKNFPSKDLKIIDLLWVRYSRNRFSLSIQKEIYLKTGNKLEEYNSQAWESFTESVGWRKYKRWRTTNEIKFNKSAPKGHLPFKISKIRSDLVILFSKL